MRAEPTQATREGAVAGPQARAQLCSQPIKAHFCSHRDFLSAPSCTVEGARPYVWICCRPTQSSNPEASRWSAERQAVGW